MADLTEETETRLDRMLRRIAWFVRAYKVELLVFLVGFLLGVWV